MTNVKGATTTLIKVKLLSSIQYFSPMFNLLGSTWGLSKLGAVSLFWYLEVGCFLLSGGAPLVSAVGFSLGGRAPFSAVRFSLGGRTPFSAVGFSLGRRAPFFAVGFSLGGRVGFSLGGGAPFSAVRFSLGGRVPFSAVGFSLGGRAPFSAVGFSLGQGASSPAIILAWGIPSSTSNLFLS